MRSKMLMRLYAVLLVICLVITSSSVMQILKVYAEEGDLGVNVEEQSEYLDEFNIDYDEEYSWPDDEPYIDPDQGEVDPDMPDDDQEVDPFDYNLICYTPSISFGTVNEGEIVYAKQFNIVNVGSTTFPLTWEEVDPYTAFDVGAISSTDYVAPGESVAFSVSPRNGLDPGAYSARITFFSADDFRRHHTATVDLTVTVKDNSPFITDVTVYPGNVTLSRGKSYRFEAYVDGGYDYDDSVTWSLTSNQSQGTKIDSNGYLKVGENETASSFAVLATSRQDPSYVGRAIVTVASIDHVVTVKASPSEGGAVAGGGSIMDGGSCTLSASPNNNYQFKGWFEGSNQISSRKNFTLDYVTSDRTIIAKFERNSCYIKTSVNDADAGTVTGSSSVAYGGNLTLKANPNGGYRFVGFVENNKTISNSQSLELNNITSDRNIVAVFERITCKVSVLVNPQDSGRFVGGGNYYKGTNVELKAFANDGYDFTGWTVNGQVVCKDYKYVINNIQNDVNVVANFMKKNAVTYTIISGIANDGGSITPSGKTAVAKGGSITYNIIPQAGYRILAVAIDNKNIGAVASYTFNNVQGDHAISAAFEKQPVETPKTAGTSTKVSEDKKEKEQTETKKTEFNDDTAAQGAVQEQKVIEEEVPEEITVLTDEDYEDDTYVTATEVVVDETVNNNSIMAKHDLDEETLRILVRDNAVLPMLKEAYVEGILMITVNNSYAQEQQETAVGTELSQKTLVNFQDVIAATLSEDEKVAVLTGTPISFNVDIAENSDSIDKGTKKIMQSKIGYKPISYFDLTVMKTSNGSTTLIENIGANLEVVIPIPKQFQKKGRKFFVIRNHNGVVDLLENVGSASDIVTFRTDKFSQYAIAYETVNVNTLILQFAIIAVISFVLAVVCYFNLVKYRRKARRERA